MTLEIESFKIESIGNMLKVGDDEFAWVKAYISFNEQETTAHPSIQMEIPIRYERSWTVGKVREVAFEKARRIIAETNNLFGKNSLEELQNSQDGREQKESAKLEEMQKSWVGK